MLGGVCRVPLQTCLFLACTRSRATPSVDCPCTGRSIATRPFFWRALDPELHPRSIVPALGGTYASVHRSTGRVCKASRCFEPMILRYGARSCRQSSRVSPTWRWWGQSWIRSGCGMLKRQGLEGSQRRDQSRGVHQDGGEGDEDGDVCYPEDGHSGRATAQQRLSVVL